MSGDLTWYKPGAEVPALLTAAADGSVPERGDGVEITGENEDMAEVGPITDSANFVATLVEVPPDYDETATYGAGEAVGEVTVLLRHYIDWLKDASGGTVTAGDVVAHDAGGVTVYDDVAGDLPADVVGPVWYSGTDGTGTSDKVAVVRQKR